MIRGYFSAFVVICFGLISWSDTAEAGWRLSRGGQECGECYNGGSAENYCSSRCHADEECDCDRECCECCGKKKPNKKKCCLFSCFAPGEAPRGGVAVSVPAQINRDAFREVVEDENKRALKQDEERDRLDTLERDLKRLAVVVDTLSQKMDR